MISLIVLAYTLLAFSLFGFTILMFSPHISMAKGSTWQKLFSPKVGLVVLIVCLAGVGMTARALSDAEGKPIEPTTVEKVYLVEASLRASDSVGQMTIVITLENGEALKLDNRDTLTIVYLAGIDANFPNMYLEINTTKYRWSNGILYNNYTIRNYTLYLPAGYRLQ